MGFHFNGRLLALPEILDKSKREWESKILAYHDTATTIAVVSFKKACHDKHSSLFCVVDKEKSFITLTLDPFDLLWHFKRGIRQQVEKFPGKTCQNNSARTSLEWLVSILKAIFLRCISATKALNC
jgi:hypothetical protein